jgi:anti-sigma B factor antagonist
VSGYNLFAMGRDVGRDSSPGSEEAVFGVEVMSAIGGTAVVAVQGEADLHTSQELRAAINDAIDSGATSLVVDLSEATFIDSMTLGVLLGAVKRLRPIGGRVSVVCTDANIRRIFEITLLDRVFALHRSRQIALDAEMARGPASG